MCNHGSSHCGARASLHEQAWESMTAPFGTQPSTHTHMPEAQSPSFTALVRTFTST